MSKEYNLRGNTIVADRFVGEFDVDVAAEDVSVASGDDGLPAGDLQEVLQALATRIQELEQELEND